MPVEDATHNAWFCCDHTPANSLGLGSKMGSKHFTLNNTYRFSIIFSVNIKKEKSI